MMHQRSASLLMVHHADPAGGYQPHRVSMVLECSLVTYMPQLHEGIMMTKRHSTLKHYAVLKGFT